MRRIRFRQSMIPRNQTDTLPHTTSTTGYQQDFINRSVSSSSSEKYPTSSQDDRESPYYSIPDVINTPSPPTVTEPILLLEGDHYHVSDDGIARSLYQLEDTSTGVSDNDNNNNSNSNSNSKMSSTNDGLMIEELYDLKRACKAFLIREKTNVRNENSAHKPVIHLGRQQESLFLQEISDGIVGAGTGSMTWDSSIAMSLYLASHPELIFGNVIELGSGVGYGGILNTLFRSYSSSAVPFHSMTLTDYSNQVLQYCKENVSRFFDKSSVASSSIQVTKLDWYDFLRRTEKSLDHAEKYDTVIACDCAYRYPDIVALVSTMKGLLKRKKTSKVHIFGPINRGGMLRLISKLRQDKSFDVREEYIDMARYRLDAPCSIDNDIANDNLQSHHVDPLQDVISSSYRDQTCKFYSRYDSKFLHVTCSLRFDTPRAKVSLSDID
jgi:predicted nicotinamide N-methyase